MGEYVAFLDVDDYWEDGKLEKQLRLIEETGAVFCSTAREILNADGKVISVKPVIRYKELLMHNCINCPSVVLKTKVAKEFPMNHEDSYEDYITLLKS